MTDATKKKTRGYRVRATYFVPADPKDMPGTRAAIDFADRFSKLPPDAPKGAIVEKFSAVPGQLEDKE